MKFQIVIFIIYALALLGEIMCIVKFFSCDFKESYKAEIIYGVSACTGIGAITGYIDFGE
jgi:hypothetical protein